jgi:hypothetical protein
MKEKDFRPLFFCKFSQKKVDFINLFFQRKQKQNFSTFGKKEKKRFSKCFFQDYLCKRFKKKFF